MKLNSGQQQAVHYMVNGFLTNEQKGMTLLGEGGTGKTTCVMYAAEEWVRAGLRVLFCAPTNKAVKQLLRVAKEYGLQSEQLHFCTLHKSLGLALLPSEERKYSAQVGTPFIGDFDVVVLDEGSMVSGIATFRYMLPELQETSTKLLIMGDKMQLSPVREQRSATLELDGYPAFELTEVERFESNSSIASVTQVLRKAIEANQKFYFDSEVLGVKTVKPAYFVKEALDHFEADTDLEQTRVLAWTNARVDHINDTIRKKIYGRNLNTYEVGERVVTGAPIYENNELILSTDEECIVTNVQETSYMIEDTGVEYNTYLLTLEPIYADIGTVHCQVIHESSQLELNEDLAKIADRASRDKKVWQEYHNLKDLFSIIKYCYCITVHRSQGSTYRKVLVDTNNILKNRNPKERNKLLYVAFSRASEELITSKEKFVS